MRDDHAYVMQVKLCKANTRGVTMVLSEHFETLNPISLNGYYEAQSLYITSSHLQQHHYTYHAKHGGKALLSFVSFLLSRWISLQNKLYLHLAI